MLRQISIILLLVVFTPTFTPFGRSFCATKCAFRHDKYASRVKLLRSEVPAGVGGTLNFTLCVAQYFTAGLPLLHLGVAQTSLNVEEQHKL